MTPSRRPPARTVPIAAVLLGVAALVTAGAGAYFVARATSIFALRQIEVAGATPEVAADVRAALRPFLGKSLVAFDRRGARLRLTGVTELAGFELDRAFPHTLRVRVRQERAVAVVRRGSAAWLVASSARVLRELDERPYPALPRIWLPAGSEIRVNATLGGAAAKAVRAVTPLGGLAIPADVRSVRASAVELTLVLASGLELRLGTTGDLRLKLAIARRILPLAGDAAYLDVSVPERPVAGYNPQVESLG